MRKESDYLIISNKKKISNLISYSELDENDIIDVLISLHLVLEVGLNTLFRHISLMSIKKRANRFEIIRNLDNISFIDKTVLFIYDSKFNFDGKMDKANKYHDIIGKLKEFSGVRNKLIHGHSISTIFDGEKNIKSPLKKELSLEKLGEQIKRFTFILEGMSFYLDCLDSPITESGKSDFKKEYLNRDFLPILRTK